MGDDPAKELRAVKVLLAHNKYQQPGGEDAVFHDEVRSLRNAGHEVSEYLEHNDSIHQLTKVQLATETIWSNRSYQRLSEAIRQHDPDIVHFHNTFPLISPSSYYAARKSGVPVVQTLHNFRLLCPNALLLRDGVPCEDCMGKTIALSGIVHGCYRGSHTESAGVAAMLAVHRFFGTWRKMVDTYIVLSQFALDRFIAGGLPPDKLTVKPNCLVNDPGVGRGSGGYAIYVGRLSKEKGIETLLAAWKRIGPRLPIKIVGDGPERRQVETVGGKWQGIDLIGPVSRSEVFSLLRDATLLVLPSTCYENFPVVVAEAFATGTPLVASDIGSLKSLVESGRTGLRFVAGDEESLAEKVNWLLDHPDQMSAMRALARAEFERKYSPEIGVSQLLRIYDHAKEIRAAAA